MDSSSAAASIAAWQPAPPATAIRDALGLMFWIVVNQGPAGGHLKTFSGPLLTLRAFAQFCCP